MNSRISAAVGVIPVASTRNMFHPNSYSGHVITSVLTFMSDLKKNKKNVVPQSNIMFISFHSVYDDRVISMRQRWPFEGWISIAASRAPKTLNNNHKVSRCIVLYSVALDSVTHKSCSVAEYIHAQTSGCRICITFVLVLVFTDLWDCVRGGEVTKRERRGREGEVVDANRGRRGGNKSAYFVLFILCRCKVYIIHPPGQHVFCSGQQ